MEFNFLILKAHAASFVTPAGSANPAGNGADLTSSVERITGSIVTILFLLGGALAVIYLLWSGIQYMTAGGSADKAKAARQGIVNAMIGIVIMMAAWAIIRLATSIGNFAASSDKGGTRSTTSSTRSNTGSGATSGTSGTTSSTTGSTTSGSGAGTDAAVTASTTQSASQSNNDAALTDSSTQSGTISSDQSATDAATTSSTTSSTQ